jgi:hypothetical protein
MTCSTRTAAAIPPGSLHTLVEDAKRPCGGLLSAGYPETALVLANRLCALTQKGTLVHYVAKMGRREADDYRLKTLGIIGSPETLQPGASSGAGSVDPAAPIRQEEREEAVAPLLARLGLARSNWTRCRDPRRAKLRPSR